MTKKSFNISMTLFIMFAIAAYTYITSAVPLTVDEISSTDYHLGSNTNR